MPGLDPDGLHRLAVRLTEATTGLCAALTPNEKGTGYCLAQAGGDVRALTKALNAALNGRGGGKPGICQGSCAAEPFPQSNKVNHRKVTFVNRYGITLAADLYEPKDAKGTLAAIAVSGPFGAVKEQSSGLYAQTMAEQGAIRN